MSIGADFDWGAFIDLASELTKRQASSGAGEAAFRTAVSRSYYGAFCLARQVIRVNSWATLTRTSQDHRIVKEYFAHNDDTTKQQIGLILGRLHRQRKQADYNNVFTEVGKAAHKCYLDAEAVRGLLSKLNR